MKIKLSITYVGFCGDEKTLSTEWDLDDVSFALVPSDRKEEYLHSEVGATAEALWQVGMR